MIVLDESLDEQRVRLPLQARWKGKIVSVRELRPGTVIKDDAVPSLLRQQRKATFVTMNVTDFWRRVPADHRYCVICVPLPTERQGELPELLLSLLRRKEFRTARKRLGKIIRLARSEIAFYGVGQPEIVKLLTPTTSGSATS